MSLKFFGLFPAVMLAATLSLYAADKHKPAPVPPPPTADPYVEVQPAA